MSAPCVSSGLGSSALRSAVAAAFLGPRSLRRRRTTGLCDGATRARTHTPSPSIRCRPDFSLWVPSISALMSRICPPSPRTTARTRTPSIARTRSGRASTCFARASGGTTPSRASPYESSRFAVVHRSRHHRLSGHERLPAFPRAFENFRVATTHLLCADHPNSRIPRSVRCLTTTFMRSKISRRQWQSTSRSALSSSTPTPRRPAPRDRCGAATAIECNGCSHSRAAGPTSYTWPVRHSAGGAAAGGGPRLLAS